MTSLTPSLHQLPDEASQALYCNQQPVRLGNDTLLSYKSKPLMDAVLAEWEALGETIDLQQLPMTRRLVALKETDNARREEWQEALLHHAEYDTLRFITPDDATLHRAQCEQWQPWRDWAQTLVSIPWDTTDSLAPPPFSDTMRAALLHWLTQRTDAELLMLYESAQLLNSFILASALCQETTSPSEALGCSWLESDLQAARWGDDVERRQQRDLIHQQLTGSVQFLQLART
jgi:chaperone required for assembly of F1-ATPase